MIINAYIDIVTGKCGFQGDALANVVDGEYTDTSVSPPNVGRVDDLRFAKIGHREFQDIEKTSGFLNGIGKERTIAEAQRPRWRAEPSTS